MSHVDEGLLHAYIDGAFEAGTPERAGIEAHLAVCADCRVRLDDARRIRDTARTALDAAAPIEVAPPPWETVLAERARRGAATGAGGPPAPRRPRIPLAWAATVVLALGAGWMARAMLAEPGRFGMEPAQTMSAESEDESAGRGVAELEAGDAAATLTVPVAEAPPPPEAPAGRPAPQTVNAPPPQVAAAPATPSFRDDSNESRRESLARQRPGAVVERAGESKAAALDRAVVTGLAARAAAQLPSTLEVAADSARDRWVPSSSEAIAAAFDRIPVTVEGQTPDTLQMATVMSRPIVRAVYILPSGVVEVLQWPVGEADVASDAVEAEEAANRLVPRRLRGVEVLVRGSSEEAVREVRGWLR